MIRTISEVHTIVMHGRPLSKWDSKDIWKKYSYQDVGVDFEPNLDIDFERIFYLTDTGRKWNDESVSIRDIVSSQNRTKYRNTNEIISAIEQDTFPYLVMINIHPHRWHNNFISWSYELVSQNIKNMIKRLISNG